MRYWVRSSFSSYARRSSHHSQVADFEHALADSATSLDIVPNQWEAHRLRATLYQHKLWYGRAVAEYTLALQFANDPAARGRLLGEREIAVQLQTGTYGKEWR